MVIPRERNIKKFTILGRKPWNFKSVVASAVYVHLVLAIIIISCLINIDRQIRFEYILCVFQDSIPALAVLVTMIKTERYLPWKAHISC